MFSTCRFDEVYDFDYSEELNNLQIYQYDHSLTDFKPLYLPAIHPSILSTTQSQHNPAQQKDNAQSSTRKVNNYPTKNCLALFKSAHFAYLQRLGINYKGFWQLVALKEKRGAARQDFVLLYRVDKLREVWKRMLQQKFIIRYIMTSRALSMQKKIYQSRVKALEKAFQKLEFDRLNDR